MVKGMSCLVGGLLMCGAFAAAAVETETPPIPDRPASELFKDAPAPWREYLVQAREAERQADPLQRCLKYPDLPGNQWPAGHTQAHCRLHVTHYFTFAEVDGYLQRGEVQVLEGRLDAMLDKHFSKTNFGEDIDVALEWLHGSTEEADRVSALWLEMAPTSPYAHLVRGNYYDAAAGKARGGRYAAETPRESFVKMSALIEQAIPRYEEAIRLEPRLLPAYAALIEAARIDSRAELERSAIERARELDPSCVELARQRMWSAQPRWGGSYEEMLSVAADMEPLVEARPLLASHLGAPYGDRGNRKIAAEELDREALDVLDTAIRKGSLEQHLQDAANVLMNSEDDAVRDGWKALAYLLQETRFSERPAWTHRNIGRMLIRLAPEMGLIHLARAAKLEPDDTYTQYAIGASLNNAGRYDAAEQHYLAALQDPQWRQRSLRELITMRMTHGGGDRKQSAAKARPFLDRLLKEYPEDGHGWMIMVLVESTLDGTTREETFNAFLKHADRDDPRQAGLVEQIERMRKQRRE